MSNETGLVNSNSTVTNQPTAAAGPKNDVGSAAGPADKSRADRIYDWLAGHGVKWGTKQEIVSWLKKTNNGNNIAKKDFEALFYKKVSFIKRLLYPSSFNYVMDVTDKVWDGHIGNQDGKADDVVDVDTLLSRLDEMVEANRGDNKNLRELLESKRVLIFDRKSAQALMEIKKQEQRDRIKKDASLDENTRAELIKKSCGYTEYVDGKPVYHEGYWDNIDNFEQSFDGKQSIKNNDIKDVDEKGKVRTDEKGKEIMKPYDYLGGEFGKAGALDAMKVAYYQANNMKGNGEEKMKKLFMLEGINMCHELKAKLDKQRSDGQGSILGNIPRTYDAMNDIVRNRNEIEKDGKYLEERLAKENAKPKKDEHLIEMLKTEQKKNREQAELYGKYNQLVEILCETDCEDPGKSLNDIGYQVKGDKPLTLRDVFYLFTKKDKILSYIEKKAPEKAQEAETASTGGSKAAAPENKQ